MHEIDSRCLICSVGCERTIQNHQQFLSSLQFNCEAGSLIPCSFVIAEQISKSSTLVATCDRGTSDGITALLHHPPPTMYFNPFSFTVIKTTTVRLSSFDGSQVNNLVIVSVVYSYTLPYKSPLFQ